jgi:hypothetical protein
MTGKSEVIHLDEKRPLLPRADAQGVSISVDGLPTNRQSANFQVAADTGIFGGLTGRGTESTPVGIPSVS